MTLRSKVRLGRRVHLEVRRKPRRKGGRLEEMTIKESRTKGEKKLVNGEGRRGEDWVLFVCLPGGPSAYNRI